MTRRPPVVVGQRFARLVAISVDHRSAAGAPFWLCSCDCGGVAIVRSDNLQTGITRSCGCLLRELLERRSLAAVAIEEHW